jgi:murein DD-endopeptidase MepM/ murein hydrolase activator NlpD
VALKRSILRGIAAAALGAVVTAGCSFGGTPDAGTLDPVFVRPAEDVRILSLGRGQTLGELLDGAVDWSEQNSLLLAFQEQASPRRLREGTEITLRYRTTDGWLRGVEVALNPDQTVQLRRGSASWASSTIVTPTSVDTLFVAGSVQTALWNAVMGNDGLAGMRRGDRASIIDYLDRVFQWQLDFSRQIRVGDTYRFVFERVARPDGSMRSGKLLAAEYENAGTAYHAVWFDPNGDGQGSYFDLDGKSVRRAFLLKPLEFRRISSRFSAGRFHPILQRVRAHRGIDYAADAGTPIMSTADGVVVHRGPKGQLGNTVEIQHPNGFLTRYGHMSGFRRGVTVGTRVRQGETIGYVGMTGLATGPHLHYEMLRGGSRMDPLSVDLPAGDPVPASDMVRWMDAMTARVALLESIPGAGPVRTVAVDAPESESDADRGGSQ